MKTSLASASLITGFLFSAHTVLAQTPGKSQADNLTWGDTLIEVRPFPLKDSFRQNLSVLPKKIQPVPDDPDDREEDPAPPASRAAQAAARYVRMRQEAAQSTFMMDAHAWSLVP
jgi:hypothetical protein